MKASTQAFYQVWRGSRCCKPEVDSLIKRHRRKLWKFALLVCSLGLSLVLAEISVRLAFPSIPARIRILRYVESERGKFCRYNDILGWEGISNVAQTFECVDTRCQVRQNQYGFRGPAFSQAKAASRRMVVLGDSFVWGFGVNDEDIFTAVMLRQASPPLEVINLGVSGYGTDQELLLWRTRAWEWKPDEVLLVVTLFTDLNDNLGTERYGYQKPAFRFDSEGNAHLLNVPVLKKSPAEQARVPTPGRATGLAASLIEHSDLACVIVNAFLSGGVFREFFEKRGLVLARGGGVEREHVLYQSPPSDAAEAAWKILAGLIGLLNAEVKQSGARLTIVAVPSPVQVYPDAWRKLLHNQGAESPGRFTLDAALPNRLLREVAERQQIGVIDLLSDFQAAARTNDFLYFPVNGHWTKAGNQLAAEVILREMRKR